MKNSYVKYDLIVLDEVQDMTKMHYTLDVILIRDVMNTIITMQIK